MPSSGPTADALERVIAEHDPDLVEAAREVDLSLLSHSLSLSPLERLRACTSTTRTLEALRRGVLAR